MKPEEFCQSLDYELNQSHSRLVDCTLIDKYSAIPLRFLGPIFDEVKVINYNWPPTSDAAAWLILASVWFRLMERRNEIHNSALEGGDVSEHRLEDFRKELRTAEQEITRRLDSLLSTHNT
jgi:hypothetical protein